MNKIALILIIMMAFTACENAKKEEKKPSTESLMLSDQIVGEWTNLSLSVTMKNEGRDSVLNVPEEKWEDVLKIKPIVTTFNDDGTFSSVYKTLENEIMMTSSGTWEVKGDTLRMTERGIDNYYHATIENGEATFTGYLDWDQDGEADDYYTGTQKKIK